MNTFSANVFRQTPYVYQFHATGQVYHSWYEITSIPAESTIYLELRQNGSNIVHVIDYILKSDSSNIEMAVYAGASFTPGTVRSNWSSYNHKITKTPTLEVYQDPTGVDLTGADQRYKTKGYGPTQGGQTTFSEVAGNIFIEEMLEEDQNYIVEITNNGTSAREFFFHVAWYESGN